MLKEPTIIWNSDGTPENEVFGDIYFSKENGLEESAHVFLQGNNLPEAWKDCDLYSIAELGFGTGLNFLNTAKLWQKSKKQENGILHYVSFEKYPLNQDSIRKAIGLWPELEELCELLISNLPDCLPGFHRIILGELKIFLTLAYGDANLLLPRLEGKIDAWYLDGFAPAKNPELWSEGLFKNIALKSNIAASVATFSAARVVKDGLSSAGFEIEIKKGFGRKRDMLTAKLPGIKPKRSKPEKIAIIGAGLAGSLSALALSHRAINCTVFEQAAQVASAASGAAAGVIMPYLTATLDRRTEFFFNSFGFAWRQILNTNFYSRCGVIRLALGATQEKAFLNLSDLPQEFAQALDAKSLSDLLGLKVKQKGFYFKTAGWINPIEYSKYALTNSKLVLNAEVARIERSADVFILYDVNQNLLGEFSKVIFANAFSATKFFPNLPIKINRGQLIQVKTSPVLSRLKHVFCHEGYIIPESSGQHLVGASYDHCSLSTEEDLGQTKELLDKLYRNLPELSALEVCGFRVGFRTTTPDRMPIVQEIEPGVFVNIAHGSRGLVTCGMAGEIIAGMINQEPLDNFRN